MRTLLFTILCFFMLHASAQQQASVWYFGEKAGLDFGGGSPRPLFNSAMSTSEGSASISDKDGSLLFYSNGQAIWNRSHEIMDNGLGLNGNTSSTQSSMIIPHPGNDSLYFVFVVDNHGGNKGVSYSMVNIHLNNGLGRVVQKNITVSQSACEKITAVHGCNDKDVWLIIRLWNSDRYLSFQIDKNGLNTEPFISFTPNNLSGHIWGTLGSMKVSPDSRRLAAAHGWSINYIELSNFNRSTGDITGVEKLFVSPPGYNGFETGPYGIEFSPDSRFLYVYAAYGGVKSRIFQYDLSLSSIAAIQSSQTLVAELNYPYAGSLQLAPDQKIYITNSFDSSLSVINLPNNPAALCDYQYAAIPLGRRVALGLPNFIQSFADPNFNPGDFSASNCESGTINFSISRPATINSVKWDFGDPSSGVSNQSTSLVTSHSYNQPGFYDVMLIAYRSCSIDTVRKKIYSGNLALQLADSYDGCNGDSLRLSVANHDGVKYYWSNGARTSYTDVVQGGKYKLTVTAGCVFGDSTTVSFFDKPVAELGPDKTICTGETVLLDPSASQVNFQWSTGATSPQLSVSQIGNYWVRITNINNSCSDTDTIKVIDKPFPSLFLGNDTLICETEDLILDPRLNTAGLSYRWQDGSGESGFRVTGPGRYIVTVSNNCTVKSDSISVTYKICPLGIPNAFSPNGDGRNDRFRAKYGSDISQYRLQIYNRFGQMVFETTDQLRGWDGTSSGRIQGSGTYAWTLHYVDTVTGKPVSLKGTVVLIR